MARDQLLRLQCEATNNDWGKRGIQSLVRRIDLVSRVDTSPTPDDDQTYAEFWMGTHPLLPSRDFVTGRTLREIIAESPQLLTETLCEKFGNELPFLFKVLSIDRALCIQAHPGQELARKLHATDSVTYPDANHKPEMAIALSRFEALCGFRPVTELSELLTSISPFHDLVGDEATHLVHSAAECAQAGIPDAQLTISAIRTAFERLVQADRVKVKESIHHLTQIARDYIRTGPPDTRRSLTADLANRIIQLSAQHADDVGLFLMLFMNHIALEPGEAMFVPSGEVHAYLHGDILECMASSANVLRAGFTHKRRDIGPLIAALNFLPAAPRRLVFALDKRVRIADPPGPSLSSCFLYDAPVEEFSMAKICLQRKGAQAVFDVTSGPSIFICMQGRGRLSVNEQVQDASFGFVFFVGDGVKANLESTSRELFVCYRAFCNVGEA